MRKVIVTMRNGDREGRLKDELKKGQKGVRQSETQTQSKSTVHYILFFFFSFFLVKS